MTDGTEPIDPQEIIYRRIPTAFMRPDDLTPLPLAFTPRSVDIHGLSVSRAKYWIQIADFVKNDRGSRYYVGEMRASALLEVGIEISPNPTQQDRGHALFPGIRYENRTDTDVINKIAALITKLTLVRGPFQG